MTCSITKRSKECISVCVCVCALVSGPHIKSTVLCSITQANIHIHPHTRTNMHTLFFYVLWKWWWKCKCLSAHRHSYNPPPPPPPSPIGFNKAVYFEMFDLNALCVSVCPFRAIFTFSLFLSHTQTLCPNVQMLASFSSEVSHQVWARFFVCVSWLSSEVCVLGMYISKG